MIDNRIILFIEFRVFGL